MPTYLRYKYSLFSFRIKVGYGGSGSDFFFSAEPDQDPRKIFGSSSLYYAKFGSVFILDTNSDPTRQKISGFDSQPFNLSNGFLNRSLA